MRVTPNEIEFCEWLKSLGDGLLPRCHGLGRHVIKLPSEFVSPDVILETPQCSAMNQNISGMNIKRPANEQDLVDFVFEKPFNKLASYQEKRAILAPLNEDILRINETILKHIDGTLLIITSYLSE